MGEEEFIKRLVKMQENVAVCASTISQWAALEAINHGYDYALAIQNKFRARREVLLKALEEDVIRDGIGRIRHFLENLYISS